MVLSSEGTVFVDPYSPGDRDNYVVYFQHDKTGVADDSCPCAMPAEEVEGRTTKEPSMGRAASRSPVVADSAPQPSLAPVEEIALERLGFGYVCPYKLTFRRDGTALRTISRGADGAADRICRGTVVLEDFVALAALMQRTGFLNLNDTYRPDPQLPDGQGAITSAVVEGRRKEVINVDRAGPPDLQAIERAIDALGRKVAWTESHP